MEGEVDEGSLEHLSWTNRARKELELLEAARFFLLLFFFIAPPRALESCFSIK